MKTSIVYYSEHHGNTRRIVEAIAEAAEEVTKAPEATEVPAVTEAPEITEAPEVTEAPAFPTGNTGRF